MFDVDEFMYQAYLQARATVYMYEEIIHLRMDNKKLKEIVDTFDKDLIRRVQEGNRFAGEMITSLLNKANKEMNNNEETD